MSNYCPMCAGYVEKIERLEQENERLREENELLRRGHLFAIAQAQRIVDALDKGPADD